MERMQKQCATPLGRIPSRASDSNPKCINLDGFYNHSLQDDMHHKPGNNLIELPCGIQKLGSTVFDIRGVIQLSGTNCETITGLTYPKEAKGISVNASALALHFLQASSWNIDAEKSVIGEYVVHYSNGSTANIPIEYRSNTWDWWGTKEEETSALPAWKGHNVRTLVRGMHIRLFEYVWKNPNPNLPIQSVDFISFVNGPGPFLVALTLE